MKTKECDYFEMFIRGSEIYKKAAVLFDEMLNEPTVPADISVKIHEIEHEGDQLCHELFYHLNRSFITPIDREDIISIARKIEDSLDALDEVAAAFDLYGIKTLRPEAVTLVKLIVQSSEALLMASTEFRHFKKSKVLNDYLVKLNDVEEEGDDIYYQALRRLFAEEKDAIEVIKWKSIFDQLEDVLDTCESVADIMAGVMIKNS